MKTDGIKSETLHAYWTQSIIRVYILLSVFIRVHPWLKIFCFVFFSLKTERSDLI